MLDEFGDDIGIDFGVALNHRLSDHHIIIEGTTEDTVSNFSPIRSESARHHVAGGRVTIIFLDNDVLHGIDQTTSKITGFSSLESRVDLPFRPL